MAIKFLPYHEADFFFFFFTYKIIYKFQKYTYKTMRGGKVKTVTLVGCRVQLPYFPLDCHSSSGFRGGFGDAKSLWIATAALVLVQQISAHN